MSKKATEFQRRAMSAFYRGKGIFKPLNTGRIDDNVACVREWVANVFFYRKGDATVMIDAGYNYDRLEEKMGWLGIDPKSIGDILITHQDTDHSLKWKSRLCSRKSKYRNDRLKIWSSLSSGYANMRTWTSLPRMRCGNLSRRSTLKPRTSPAENGIRASAFPMTLWALSPWKNC